MFNMLLLITTSLLVSAAAAETCSHVYDGQYYNRTTILSKKGLPTNLAINPTNKDLFFTLIDIDSLHNDNVQTKMDQYVLRDDNAIKIDNIKGQAAAVDVKHNKVYIATDEGLTVLDELNTAKFVSLRDEDIVQIFKPHHKNVLYATLFPGNDVFTIDLNTHEKTKIENIPCAYFLAVDDKDNIFYECNSKYVKVLLKGFQEPIEFVGLPKNAGRAIALDGKKAILATNDGLYHLKPDNMIPAKVMDLDVTPSGLAFDGFEFYVASTGEIYKYTLCMEEEEEVDMV